MNLKWMLLYIIRTKSNTYIQNMGNQDENAGGAIIFFFLFLFFVFFIVFGLFVSFMDIAYAIDHKIQRYNHEHRIREAANAYHNDMRRQLAILKTQEEILELEKKLTTTT